MAALAETASQPRLNLEAFGLQMPGRVYVSGTPTREGFTGHELDAETGMNYAGARYYMPALGRWTSVDPLAVGYPSLSPYNYVANNPISLVDPNGMWIQDVDEDGNITYTAEDGDNVRSFSDQFGVSNRRAYNIISRGGLFSNINRTTTSGNQIWWRTINAEVSAGSVASAGSVSGGGQLLSLNLDYDNSEAAIAGQWLSAISFTAMSGESNFLVSQYFSSSELDLSKNTNCWFCSASGTATVGGNRFPVTIQYTQGSSVPIRVDQAFQPGNPAGDVVEFHYGFIDANRHRPQSMALKLISDRGLIYQWLQSRGLPYPSMY